MKWFWVISCDNTVPNPLVAYEGELGEFEDELDICRPIDVWPGTAWVGVGREGLDGDPDDVLQTCFPLPIYSSRLRWALVAAGISVVQYLPIQVFLTSGEPLTGFSVANILNSVDALDLEHSTVERYEADYFLPNRRGLISGVTRPVLVRRAVVGYDIVRLSSYQAPIYVSERFVGVFESGNFTGYSFCEVGTV
jgi:hypothetical protein